MRRWSIAIVVIVALVMIGAGFQLRRQAARARLPQLPDLAAHSKAIGEHLRERDAVARADPTSATVVGALCLAYHADLIYDRAERCYVQAEALDPSDWQWTYYRALAESERGSVDALAAGMRKVVAVAPDYGPAWWRLGEAEFKEGRYEAAAEAWRRAQSSREPDRSPPGGTPVHSVSVPLSSYATLGLARVALVQGDVEGARQILEPLTAAVPAFGPAFRLLGEAYLRLGREADSMRVVAHADRQAAYASYSDPMVDRLARESRSSTFLLQQAAAVDSGDNAPWKEYLLVRAVEFDPSNPAVLYELGTLRRSLGRNAEALELFLRYAQLVPDDYQGLGQIGSCLGDLGRYTEAESYLRRAAELAEDAITHYDLGVVLTRMGRVTEAVGEYERALERDPTHVRARTNLAVNLVNMGQLARAARELGRVLEIEPENAGAHTNLGLVLAQQGQLARAVHEFREALRIDPQQSQARTALDVLER
ncbi:MAG TPA: tetratricopeptide repeat protein [Vicinamibacterales bacterium]|nr:tetratricopeptide repeat protein [Vicinamibacterales bacterium]